MRQKFSAIFTSACFVVSFALAWPALAEPSAEAKAYLDQAIELIRANHRKSAQGDWPKINAEAQLRIADAKSTKDTYPAIRSILATLNEPHSFLIDPIEAASSQGNQQAKQPNVANKPPMPAWQIENRRFGVLTLPGLIMLGDSGWQKGQDYMNTARNGLIKMDKNKICGWVIDLRQNDGGNMWPMMWSVDPLLGPSPFGAFLPVKGKTEKWVRAQDQIFPTSETLPETVPNFRLKHETAPLAVLIGPGTGSSGEMMAIAFIGRKNVRVFGNPSYGFTSANKTYPLNDGAFLVLTETSVSDRSGKEYFGPIVPDERVSDENAKAAAMK